MIKLIVFVLFVGIHRGALRFARRRALASAKPPSGMNWNSSSHPILIVTLARVVRGNRHRNHVDDDDDDDAPRRMDAKRDDDDASTRRRVSFASTVVEVRRDGTKRNDDDSVRREKRGIGESL